MARVGTTFVKAVTVAGLLVSACGPNLAALSSGEIGCREANIQISDDTLEFGESRTWTATCQGRVFRCTASGDVSCKEAIDEGEPSSTEMAPAKPTQAPVARHAPAAPGVKGEVSRTLLVVAGGQLRVSGRPKENGSQLALRLMLVGEPDKTTSWEECGEAHAVAEGTKYPLRDVAVTNSDRERGPTMKALASVAAVRALMRAQDQAAIVVCGKENALDVRARRTLFDFFQEFQPIAVDAGTWDASPNDSTAQE